MDRIKDTLRAARPRQWVKNLLVSAPITAGDDRPGHRLTRLTERLRFFMQPPALPTFLLILALSTVFLFAHDRGSFYRDGGHHDWNSAQTLAFAENLSFEHKFLVFHYKSLDSDGNVHYPSLYNRFPLGGYALVKLAILPFDGLSAKIYAARLLMLVLFSAAALLAYHALARLIASRWIALTATLLAFSSYYLLYYSDKISNEVTIDLFAVMLVFHGMVIFEQEGRFRQLLLKSCIALLLGWHVYAFLLPFIIFGLARALLKARASTPPPPPPPRNLSQNQALPCAGHSYADFWHCSPVVQPGQRVFRAEWRSFLYGTAYG